MPPEDRIEVAVLAATLPPVLDEDEAAAISIPSDIEVWLEPPST